ncbi:MAG TPA: aromatic ring-hydroxylating dioxygenase subunit alpha [Methylomirabilota bacterium]|nr:aromatic ring-hydroxylating dioxygenase subunit alpha [Methylomirabilota bacterium]
MRSGYGRPTPSENAELTHIGPGTPAGELFRRYWQPVGLAPAPGDRPRPLRVLGEDLVLFRDGHGRPGLLDAHCCHRGTSLEYGRVEADGLRCCYHGWLFDVEGRCLEQPCEPAESTYKDRVFQPGYPCREYGGLVFAYMGPPDRMPLLPQYDLVEEGEGVVIADATSYGLGGGEILGCNWLQIYENVMDPFHVAVLHSVFSGGQFSDALNLQPRVSWEEADAGVRSTQDRALPDGRLFRRVTEILLPNIRIVPSVAAGEPDEGFERARHIGWILPIDDTHTRMYSLLRVPLRDGEPVLPPRARHGGKLWAELSEEEHHRMPGDEEAIVSQGPIAIHADEHLASSDRGVILTRKLIARAIAAVRGGADPPGVLRDRSARVVTTHAGNAVLAAGPHPLTHP